MHFCYLVARQVVMADFRNCGERQRRDGTCNTRSCANYRVSARGKHFKKKPKMRLNIKTAHAVATAVAAVRPWQKPKLRAAAAVAAKKSRKKLKARAATAVAAEKSRKKPKLSTATAVAGRRCPTRGKAVQTDPTYVFDGKIKDRTIRCKCGALCSFKEVLQAAAAKMQAEETAAAANREFPLGSDGEDSPPSESD